jgi:hypothetical protein
MTLEHFDTILAFVLIITGVSLIITTLTQMVSALLGLRGTNLRWGLETLLANVDPSLKDHAGEISRRVLQHALASDSVFSKFETNLIGRWRLASAIRQDELIAILRMLPAEVTGQSTDGKKTEWAAVLQKSLDELDPKAANDLVLVATEVKKLFPNDAAKAEKIMAPLIDSATTLPAKIDQWFDSVMDRSAQRFTLHMRIWTVFFAVLLAFALQLDTFSLFTALSTDAQLRAQIITSADTLQAKADDLLATTTNASPAAYGVAMKQLVAEHTNELRVADLPAGFTSLAAAEDWLAAELKKQNISDPDNRWARHYEEMIPQAKLRAATENLNSVISDKLIVQLVPQPYPNPFYKNWQPTNRVFWGILASAALLSLGAPFWFNVLKNLSNLRPLLAKKQESED